MTLISLVPANFDPPECDVVTDHSSVAAGGIAIVSSIDQAQGLQVDDRLCGSLILLIQESSRFLFRNPGTSSRLYRLTPIPLHSAVWTFLPADRRGENPGS